MQVAEDKKMRENQSRTKRLAWSNRINVPCPSIPMCLHFYRRSFPVSVGVLQRKQRRIYMPSSFKDNDNLWKEVVSSNGIGTVFLVLQDSCRKILHLPENVTIFGRICRAMYSIKFLEHRESTLFLKKFVGWK